MNVLNVKSSLEWLLNAFHLQDRLPQKKSRRRIVTGWWCKKWKLLNIPWLRSFRLLLGLFVNFWHKNRMKIVKVSFYFVIHRNALMLTFNHANYAPLIKFHFMLTDSEEYSRFTTFVSLCPQNCKSWFSLLEKIPNIKGIRLIKIYVNKIKFRELCSQRRDLKSFYAVLNSQIKLLGIFLRNPVWNIVYALKHFSPESEKHILVNWVVHNSSQSRSTSLQLKALLDLLRQLCGSLDVLLPI